MPCWGLELDSYTPSNGRKLVVTVLDTIVIKGEIAHLERKNVKNTDKILEYLGTKEENVTLKELQDALEMKPGILSGTLVALLKSGRVSREKIEKTSGQGPKMQWAYKIVAQIPQTAVESSVD